MRGLREGMPTMRAHTNDTQPDTIRELENWYGHEKTYMSSVSLSPLALLARLC